MDPQIEVGIYAAYAPDSDKIRLQEFLQGSIGDVASALEAASGAKWNFHVGDPVQLKEDVGQRAPDFVPEASRRLAESSFDLVIVLADIPILSAKDKMVAGLTSEVTRTVVLSVPKLRSGKLGKQFGLDSEAVRWNGATLLLHLIGHAVGMGHRQNNVGVMAPFVFDESRRSLPAFRDPQEFRKRVSRFPEREYRTTGLFQEFWLHLTLALRHPGTILLGLWRNRALLLPLKMPGLATAAVAPTFLLVFTAEFWDAGLGMSNLTAFAYAALSIAAATIYLAFVQNLFLPRREEYIVTEHLAVANVLIFLTMLLAMIGLFLMVSLLMLLIETWVFPQGLISTWPTLQDPEVTFGDKFRLASFISTVGVTTGALAGGLERRNVLRGLALFQRQV